MSDMNKVRYGLRNVYYAKATIGEDGTYTYGTPVRIPGAVSLSLDAEGDTNTFYADDVQYYVSVANNGYSGDFECAKFPDSFMTDILNMTTDTNGVMIEKSDAIPNPFALLFEFEGDKNAVRHCLYNCTCARPSLESETTEDSIEPKTESAEITASPRTSDNVVKSRCGDTSSSAYAGWYTKVYEPKADATDTTTQNGE